MKHVSEFNEILLSLRKEREITQKELAKQCNISPQCISSLELGSRNPTGSTIVALAKFFEVSTDYLLGLEDDFGSRVTGEGNQLEAAAMYTDKERDLIDAFRKLMPETQDFILRTARSLQDNRDKIDLK